MKKCVIISLGTSRKEYPFLFNWVYLTSPGIHYVNAVLVQGGYETHLILKVNENLTTDEVTARANEINPDIVLFNQFFFNAGRGQADM